MWNYWYKKTIIWYWYELYSLGIISWMGMYFTRFYLLKNQEISSLMYFGIAFLVGGIAAVLWLTIFLPFK